MQRKWTLIKNESINKEVVCKSTFTNQLKELFRIDIEYNFNKFLGTKKHRKTVFILTLISYSPNNCRYCSAR